MTKWIGRSVALLVASLGVACGAGSNMMGSSMNGSENTGASGVAFISVSPAGGATGIGVGAPIAFRFSGGMGEGMEQYMDVHMGDLSGPEMSMNCAWSVDRTLLTCTPSSPLAAHTTYAIHLGGGMVSARGTAVDYTAGLGMGGQWIMGGMMTGTHGGMAWGTMGSGWRNANGSYGMMFTFTTT
jgi:Big-like domain-containing protein